MLKVSFFSEGKLEVLSLDLKNGLVDFVDGIAEPSFGGGKEVPARSIGVDFIGVSWENPRLELITNKKKI
jgi:hypothetical protein